MSISELIKIVLDEIVNVADTYVAVNCLLLSSTFYFNPASQGGQNSKKFLYELISDHKIWQEIDFWERAITCKQPLASFNLYLCRINPEGPELAPGLEQLPGQRGGKVAALQRGGVCDPV